MLDYEGPLLPHLAARAVMLGLWNAADVLDAAERVGGDYQRGLIFAALLGTDVLTPDQRAGTVRRALDIALTYPRRRFDGGEFDVLDALAPHLAGDAHEYLPPRAVRRLEQLEVRDQPPEPLDRAALEAKLAKLPTMGTGYPDFGASEFRVGAVIRIAPLLSGDLLARALEIAREAIYSHGERAMALAVLSDQLPEVDRGPVLAEALALALDPHIGRDFTIRAGDYTELSRIVPRLTGELHRQALAAVMEKLADPLPDWLHADVERDPERVAQVRGLLCRGLVDALDALAPRMDADRVQATLSLLARDTWDAVY